MSSKEREEELSLRKNVKEIMKNTKWGLKLVKRWKLEKDRVSNRAILNSARK